MAAIFQSIAELGRRGNMRKVKSFSQIVLASPYLKPHPLSPPLQTVRISKALDNVVRRGGGLIKRGASPPLKTLPPSLQQFPGGGGQRDGFYILLSSQIRYIINGEFTVNNGEA
jgi:hypothetical protein